MSLTIYNTLAREKQVFTPIDPKHVRMYVCGRRSMILPISVMAAPSLSSMYSSACCAMSMAPRM